MMLTTLRRIVQDVNSASDLDDVLTITVGRVKAEMKVDVCSIYLKLPGNKRLTLMASDGLNPTAIRRITLDPDEGLIGQVTKRAEPVNLSDAATHPSYKFIPETGEEKYHAFLGVPIVHRRRSLGVLVIQQRAEREFDEEHVSFLVTLAVQLAGAINSVEFSGELQGTSRSSLQKDIFIDGIAGAPGVGIGNAQVIFPVTDLNAVPDREAKSIDDEIQAFRLATTKVRHDMLEIKDRMIDVLPTEDRLLFDAYVLMLGSDTLVENTLKLIREGNWAPGALRKTIQDHAHQFDVMEDAYLRERGADIRELGRRLLDYLLSEESKDQELAENTILVGKEITAAQLAELPIERIAGLVCTTGTNSSHAAILARAIGIPTVMGASDFPLKKVDGKSLIVDGYSGRVYLQPSYAIRVEFERLATEEKALTTQLLSEASNPAKTLDGKRVPIFVNSGLMAELVPSQAMMMDGIGLYRTEVPFMVRDRFPGEVEQTEIYRQVLNAFPRQPVTLRTLDVGGDKALSYFPIEEDNPFLGYRGIRISLDHPEIFLTQLRAMLIANQGIGNLHVLFPTISSLKELQDSLRLLNQAKRELIEEGIKVAKYKVGVMIEIPSAVHLTEVLAAQVDYLSVGTNDLIQYLLAVDRNNAAVAELYNEYHPAVLASLKLIVEGAKRAKKPVSICGEMASDPASALLLLGCGIDSLSVSMASLPRIKWIVRSFSCQQMRQIFDAAMQLHDPAEIRTLADNALIKAGLGALVRAGSPNHHVQQPPKPD